MSNPRHVPVLLEEVLDLLNVRPGGTYADATLGLAGHSSAIARRLGGSGTLIGFDRDPQAMALATATLDALREELGEAMPTVRLIPRAFSSAAEEIERNSLNGLLADFGVSSLQLDEAHRGFSFRQDAPLDMRMDTRGGETAEQVVNQADEEGTRQPDLRIRRGKEVAENRQSHCAGAADYNNGGVSQSCFGRCPINERRQVTSRNTYLSGASNSCER